jgi:hypothetical protein
MNNLLRSTEGKVWRDIKKNDDNQKRALIELEE